jgi:hypothetical protein
MSRANASTALHSYITEIENTKKNNMTTPKRCDVIPLFPEKEDAANTAGWDPYIFSIIMGRERPAQEERRRIPRPLTASRRRALLLSTRHKARPKPR